MTQESDPSEIGEWHRLIYEGENAMLDGHYDEAERLYLAALRAAREASPSDPFWYKTLANLHYLYVHYLCPLPCDPQTYYERTVPLWEGALGPNHHLVALWLRGLAPSFERQGEYARAEALYRKILATWESSPGADQRVRDGRLAHCLHGLGRTCDKQGRHGEAAGYLGQAVAILERSFGPDAPELVPVLESFTEVLRAAGRDAEGASNAARASRIRALYPPCRFPACGQSNEQS